MCVCVCVEKQNKTKADGEGGEAQGSKHVCQVTPVLRGAVDSYVKCIATLSCHRCITASFSHGVIELPCSFAVCHPESLDSSSKVLPYTSMGKGIMCV